MNESTERRTEPAGRSMDVLAYGNTADEIELAALDEVRKFFGADLRLEVVRSYYVTDAGTGKAGKYMARVAADRAILAEHEACDFLDDGREVCGRCMEHRRRGRGWKFMPAPCPTIRLLAEGLGWRDGSSE